MRALNGVDEVKAAVGTHLGQSDWLTLTQERVDDFTTAVGSDEGMAFLVLSLSNYFLPQIVEVQGFSAGINYGTNEIRFPTPAAVGAKLRGTGELVAADEIPGGLQTQIRITIEMDGADEPACVIESLSRWLV
jgi:acyl dehydratase